MLRQHREPQSINHQSCGHCWHGKLLATGAEGQAQAQAQGSSAPTAMGKHSLEHRGESRDPPAPAPAVADETAETSTVRRLLRGQRGHATGHSPSSCQPHQPAASQLMGLMSLGTDTPAPRDQVSHLQRKSCSQPPTAKPRINSSLETGLSNPAAERHLGGLGGLFEDSTGKQQRRRGKTRNYFIIISS